MLNTFLVTLIALTGILTYMRGYWNITVACAFVLAAVIANGVLQL